MTAFDLYEMIVGEGGIAPEYFLHKMQWWEVNRYLAGIRRRYHGQWETTRWTITHIANMFREKGRPPFNPQDVVKFPWEKDEQDQPTITDDEVAALQAEMDAWNASQAEAPDES